MCACASAVALQARDLRVAARDTLVRRAGQGRAATGTSRRGARLERLAHGRVGEEELAVQLRLGVAQHLVHVPLHLRSG